MNNDLISRSALLEIVEPRLTSLRKEYGNYDHYTDGYEECADLIEAAHAVDAVPVVRCRECKHIENSPYGRYCTVWHGHNGMGDDGFCNYGERKTE